MQNTKHIVIFSHGFGTKKDDRGLLSGPNGIAESITDNNVEVVLFDYNEIDEFNNTVTVKALSEQIRLLDKEIIECRNKYPNAIVDIIAHSQGCLVPAILLPKGIRKTIFIAPSLNADNQRMINLFKDDPKTVIDLEGVSFLGRKDGTTTIVPSLYWKDRENANPIPLYNIFSLRTELTIINANQDDILRNFNMEGLNKSIKIVNIDGDHSFNGQSRENLIKYIKNIIL